jgi:hypothetical protein
MINVLVFPGGTEIGLEIQRSLSQYRHITLFSAGNNRSNHAPFIFARHLTVPSIHEKGWIDSLNSIIDNNCIDYIFPAYDDVIIALMENAEHIRAPIVTSPLETCRITRSKSKTYEALQGLIPVPKLLPFPPDMSSYPVFVKPDKGQGSQDTHIVYNQQQLESVLSAGVDKIIVEYLPGSEFTVDCFSDRESGVLFCAGRTRTRVKSGISMHSEAFHDECFHQYAKVINAHLPMYGAWFFQLKQDYEGHYKLLEVAPRIAGTMAFHRVLGVNFPLLSLYECQRVPIEILTNNIELQVDRALTNRYSSNIHYSTVYVDLDDTLIVRDEVNIDLIRLIYQCLNRGIRVILITKHTGDLDKTLRKYRLADIFDSVIHVQPDSEKADYIQETQAIFIDDSFSERKKVAQRFGMPTFDSSMIEMLFDERG